MAKRVGVPAAKVWLRYLGPFILILLPSLVFYAVFYRVSYNAIRSSIIENKLADVSRSAASMDRDLYDLKRMILYYPRNTSLLEIDVKDRMDPYDHWVLEQSNAQYALSIPIVDDIFFYIPRDDLIVTASGSFRFDRYFDQFMANPARNKYFWRQYLDTSTREETFPAERYIVNNFASASSARTLIVMATRRSTFKNMRLVIVLNAEKIRELYGEDFLIFNATGTPILGDPGNPQRLIDRIRGGLISSTGAGYSADPSGYSFYVSSQSFPWYYAKVVPYAKVYGDLHGFNRVVIAMVLFLLCVGLLLAYYFSHRLSRPIRDIMRLVSSGVSGHRLRGTTEEQRIVRYIRSVSAGYESIVKKHNALKADFQEYFLGSLASDPSRAPDRRILRALEFEASQLASFFAACYAVGSGGEARDADTILRAAAVPPGSKRSCFFLHVGRPLRAAIVAFAGDESWIADFRRSLADTLARQAEPGHIVLAVSKVFHGIDEIGNAYEDAAQLFQERTLRRVSQLLTHESVSPAAAPWADPREKARCLLKLSKYAELRAMFGEMLSASESGSASARCVRRSFAEAFLAMAESADGQLAPDRLGALHRELDDCVTAEDFQDVAERMIRTVGGADGQAHGTNSGEVVVERICQFIEENYASSDISLRSLADRYKMSPAYLSRLFLELRRVKYSDFLFDVRMQKARAALVREDIRIKDLCAAVGYRNPNVFIKAFRKRFGVSPGEYKRLFPTS